MDTKSYEKKCGRPRIRAWALTPVLTRVVKLLEVQLSILLFNRVFQQLFSALQAHPLAHYHRLERTRKRRLPQAVPAAGGSTTNTPVGRMSPMLPRRRRFADRERMRKLKTETNSDRRRERKRECKTERESQRKRERERKKEWKRETWRERKI